MASEASDPGPLIDLIERVDLAPGQLTLRLSASALSKVLELPEVDIAKVALTSTVPFQSRKRGVETKLILGVTSAARPVDRTLLTNIARARSWFECLTLGESYDTIAAAAGVPKDRVLKLMPFAFLAPCIVEQVLDGAQPVGLTTEYLIRNTIPSDWDEQVRLFARLK